jgi:hypothetical protein
MPTQAQAVDSQAFCKDCEKFLTYLVLSFQKQSGDVAALASKVQALSIGLANSVSPPVPVPSMFASLQQSLGAGVPAGNPGTFPQEQGDGTVLYGGSPAATMQAAQTTTIAALEHKVNLLEAKFTQLSSHSASTTVKFRGAGFTSHRDVIPLIQAEMPTSYFGCFVNAAILFEWIQGNVGDDTLKNMEHLKGHLFG